VQGFARRLLLRLGERELSRQVGIAVVLLLEGGRLARRLGAQAPQRVGDGFAVLLIALSAY
jgi:hypothetical protein